MFLHDLLQKDVKIDSLLPYNTFRVATVFGIRKEKIDDETLNILQSLD